MIVNHQIHVVVKLNGQNSKIEELINFEIDSSASEEEIKEIKHEAAIDWMLGKIELEWKDQ